MIRPAQRDDVPVLIEMIRELAEFEELLDEVQIDNAMLEDALFGDDATAFAFVAIADGTEAGMAICFRTLSTWTGRPGVYLEDLYVRPSFRRRGLGSELLHVVANETLVRGGGRLEWAVLNWNQKAIDVYRSIGAIPMEEWTRYRLAGPALRQFIDRKMTSSTDDL